MDLTENRLKKFKTLIVVSYLLLIFQSCARMGSPTGGPEDKEPPTVVAVSPGADSSGVPVDFSPVAVTFSEPVKRQEAQRLVRIFPDPGLRDIGWKGTTLKITPVEPLRQKITYRVVVDKGIHDVHGVISNKTAVSYFSTGERFSPGKVEGLVERGDTAVVEAVIKVRSVEDTSLVFSARADSSGRYEVPYLPLGEFKVLAFMDDNLNAKYDYTREYGADTLVSLIFEPVTVNFKLQIADTTAPQLTSVETIDSLGLRAVFDDQLDTTVALRNSMVLLRSPDSTGTIITVDSLAYDSTDTRAVTIFSSAIPEPGTGCFLSVNRFVNQAGIPVSVSRNSKQFNIKDNSSSAVQPAKPERKRN